MILGSLHLDPIPHWSADQWSAFGNVILGIGALVAGGWTFYGYRKARRSDAARWLQGVFRDFYLDDRFATIRSAVEYEYSNLVGPLVERRITDRDVPLSAGDKNVLAELDSLLNYFEHVLYLEHEGHLRRGDTLAVLEYWFDIMSSDERAGIRRYVSRWGYERVAKALRSPARDLVAFYGSLQSGLDLPGKPDLSETLRLIGPCQIRGALFDLGDYPGLDPRSSRSVEGELYEVVDDSAWATLDAFERYDAHDVANSLYLRRCVRLVAPAVDAWVYVFNGDLADRRPVESGNWRDYLASRAVEGLGPERDVDPDGQSLVL